MRTMLTAVILAALVVPSATADASVWSQQVDCKPRLKQDYRKHYRQVRHRLGHRAPGRQILKHGVRFKGVTFVATCPELRRSRGQLKKLLRSPPYSHSVAVAPPQPPASVLTDQTVANGGSSNSMVDPNCESGGNPQALDPSGTYWGKYQFDAQTWAAYAPPGAAYGSAPEWVQDQAAANVPYDAWPNC